MPDHINPSMYLPNDPEKINSLNSIFVPKNDRLIDRTTLVELGDIAGGIFEVIKTMKDMDVLEKLVDYIRALISLINEGCDGLERGTS